uniref:Uncharacterized protein n=1 Tax=Anguilla anguilla TaxID=7936 RepID=A0A0E9UD71_ANGAN
MSLKKTTLYSYCNVYIGFPSRGKHNGKIIDRVDFFR